jgi:hypothetical protein
MDINKVDFLRDSKSVGLLHFSTVHMMLRFHNFLMAHTFPFFIVFLLTYLYFVLPGCHGLGWEVGMSAELGFISHPQVHCHYI